MHSISIVRGSLKRDCLFAVMVISILFLGTSRAEGGGIRLGFNARNEPTVFFAKPDPYGDIDVLSLDQTAQETSKLNVRSGLDVRELVYIRDSIILEGDISRGDAQGDFTIYNAGIEKKDIRFVAGEDVQPMIDTNDDGEADWWRLYHDGDFYVAGNVLAEINEHGNLRVRGTVTPNTSFDLAENFQKGEAMEPGDMVRIDVSDSSVVRLATNAGDGVLAGIVSQSPGVVLGGPGFSSQELERIWGQGLASKFYAEKDALKAKVLAENPKLAANQASAEKGKKALTSGDSEATEELLKLERDTTSKLDTLVLNRFAQENLVPVALAGRVPVKVETVNGPILVGDYLTAGPRPGIGVKAVSPGPVVAIALEPLAAGEGKVMALVNRGWYGADGAQTVSGAEDPGQSASLEKESDITDLKERIKTLENLVADLLDQNAPR